MVVWRRANIMLANIIHGDPSHESTPLPRRPRRGGLYFCVKRAKNKGRVLSAAPRLGMFQLVTGDGGRLGHKLAIRTIYLIHSNRFRSKGELGHRPVAQAGRWQDQQGRWQGIPCTAALGFPFGEFAPA